MEEKIELKKRNPSEETIPPEKIEKKKKNVFKKILIGLLIFILIILIVGGGLGYFGYTVYKDFQPEQAIFQNKADQFKAAVKEQNLIKVKDLSDQTKKDLDNFQKKVDKYSFLSTFPFIKDYFLDIKHVLTAGRAGLNSADLVVETLLPYSDILGLGGEKTSTASGKTTMDRITFLVTTLDKVRPKLDLIGNELETAKKEMDSINPDRYPQEIQGIKIRESLALGIKTIDQGSSFINDAKPLLESLPEMLGVSVPKYYFVIFQNDAELRPTGGFMTAYGILKVDKGKITPVLSEDIYSLDNALNKKIPVPDPIKKYHKNVFNFYMRDMNLSPDFAESMKLFMSYYIKIPGAKKVDGVVGVDTKLLVSLLKILGKVGVGGDWGEFSAEPDKRCLGIPNVVCQLEEIADKPISGFKTSRKAVIGPLMHSILSNAFGSKKEKVAEVFNVALTSIQEKHVLFYMFDEKQQKAVEAFNLGGRVRDYEGDYQLLVDTNFAGAKSNLFITQKIDEKIEIAQDGTVTKTIGVTYNNPVKGSNCNLEAGQLCLNGLYRDWFRLYVPKGSELIEMTGSEVTPVVYEELGKTVFEGFYGDKYPLRPESMTKISFKYKLPFKVESGKEYKLLIQKQAGVEKYEMKIDFNGKKQEFDLRTDKEIKF